ncbi:MAG: fumarylacetoacetate hydrolase family protein [Thermoflexales bacterium]|nr:fumarylacetoacetate hydrolase family protein [Thermoflexales bacterium]
MKLITYQHGDHAHVGAVTERGVIDLSSIVPDMLTLIEGGPAALAQARSFLTPDRPAVPIESVTLLTPIPRVRRNVMCLGLNYVEHAKESAEARGREFKQHQHPVFFTKATHAINGPEAAIPFDAAVSEQIDFEAELAVIIGRGGKNIANADALDHVFGYTCLNDVSARDLQTQHSQFFKGKSLDGACPIGPWIITADELADPQQLNITCRVNGVTKQDSNTRYMIFNIPTIIEILSRGMTLDAGDIIATGTPSGVGFARKPPEFLRPGDVVEVEIEGIGILRNRIGE